MISDYYLKKKTNIPHWIVAFKRFGNEYYFMDSANGIISLAKEELKKGFELNSLEDLNKKLQKFIRLQQRKFQED